ncbi:MAG: hypothetical protein V1667_03710 [bacterium]
MDYKFSQKLRDKLISYFANQHNLAISQNQAEEYLDSMADLYHLFSVKEIKNRDFPARR